MSLLLQITLFLGAALMVVPLLKRFGIATVLGYLITGILLGPHVLNIANDPEAIQQLAEFGVILLMFFLMLTEKFLSGLVQLYLTITLISE